MHRAGVIALLVFQAVWLNVILPGHTRGAVTLPGYDVSAEHTCCSSNGQPDSGDEKNGRAAHCAVCFFAARLSIPVAIDLSAQPLRLCGRTDPPTFAAIASLELQLTYLGRAPPAL